MIKEGGQKKSFLSLKDKKGLSAVVATLLIILLVLVAIGIIWAVIRNVIESGAEQIELGQRCINVEFSSVGVLPVEGQAGSYSVTLTRSGSGEAISGVKITLFNLTSNSGVLEFGESLSALDTKTRTIGAGVVNANRFDMTPYFESASGIEQLCPQTRSFSLGSSGSATPIGNGNGGNGDGDGNGDGGTGGTCNNNGICDATETVESCPADCSVPVSCDGVWNQTEDTGAGLECDGGGTPGNVLHCQTNCFCEPGFSSDGAGGCALNPALNTGTINSVWNSIFFDSHDLPKDSTVNEYINDYVNFSGSAELGCFLITFADYIADNDISYIRVDDTLGAPNINSGEGYSIWEAANCGL